MEQRLFRASRLKFDHDKKSGAGATGVQTLDGSGLGMKMTDRSR
jgi:hypothetical protein